MSPLKKGLESLEGGLRVKGKWLVRSGHLGSYSL